MKMNNNNTITVTINKDNLTYITTKLKEAYRRNWYFASLRIYADKYNIMQDKVDYWTDKECEYYDKYNTIDLTLLYLNLGKYAINETEKEAFRIKEAARAIKKLGLEDKEWRLINYANEVE